MGREHALLLGSRGAKVVVDDFGGELDGSGFSKDPADQVVKEIVAAGGEAVACYADVSKPKEAASIIDIALSNFGKIDIVVNNAGISDPGAFGDLPLSKFKKMIEVHYYGMLHVSKAAWPHMLEAGYGRIIQVTSESVMGMAKLTSYGSAKGACFAFIRNLATDAVGTGIQVNGIMPRGSTRMADARGPWQSFWTCLRRHCPPSCRGCRPSRWLRRSPISPMSRTRSTARSLLSAGVTSNESCCSRPRASPSTATGPQSSRSRPRSIRPWTWRTRLSWAFPAPTHRGPPMRHSSTHLPLPERNPTLPQHSEGRHDSASASVWTAAMPVRS